MPPLERRSKCTPPGGNDLFGYYELEPDEPRAGPATPFGNRRLLVRIQSSREQVLKPIGGQPNASKALKSRRSSKPFRPRGASS